LIRLPGCGHVPMNDDPALVARVLLDGSRAQSARALRTSFSTVAL
ncbi:alpha/beta hydrolase, partial [Streptomyces scabiei]